MSHPGDNVTIVLPVYNGLPYVHEAVASVLAQTRRDWRLLLIDDASTDGSAEAIDTFDDPRIEVRRHATNIGLYATLAEAVAHVDTEFVSILMQDDRLHPDYLSALGSLAARFPTADAFWICEDTIDGEGRVIGRGQSSGRVEPIRPGVRPWRRALMKGCIWTISGSFTRRSLLAEVPFRPDLPHCADYQWFLRASRTRPFVDHQRPLIDLRQHEGQATTRHIRQGRNMTEMCAVMEEQLDQHPADLSFLRVCGVSTYRAWQCARLLAGNLLHGHGQPLAADADRDQIRLPATTRRDPAVARLASRSAGGGQSLMLAAIETHPIQYHAPLYRLLQQRFGVPVTAIYASDFSVRGYRDQEFGVDLKWDTDLLSGYTPRFLASVASGGPDRPERASAAGLRQVLAEIAPAAVLICGYGFAFHRRAWLDVWRGGYPIMFRGETTDDAQDRSWAKDVVRSTALRVAYRSCARFLYIGQQSHAHYRRLGIPESRLVFSPYCVDTAPFETSEAARDRLRPAARQALGIADDRFVLLFSGKLSDRKGVDLLIDAARALPEALRRRVVLVFVGQGERREALVATACLPPAVDVRFAGFQTQSALSRFYHAADLLVLPSRTAETWGLVVNEALHHGLPCVVSSRVGCGPDLIEPERTGTRAPTGSAAELAAAIAGACGLAGRREIRDACRERAAQYGLEPAAAGIARAYQDVIAVGAGAPSYAR